MIMTVWTGNYPILRREKMEKITIRRATPGDAGLILDFIKELAVYEKMENDVVASVDGLRESLLSEGASAKALIVCLDGKPIGYAVFFYNYSTWLGKNGLYLEDLYITRKYRGCGAGKTVLRYLAKLAVDQGCGRFEWSVLDWNEPAIEFYRSIHAKPQDEWVLYRLDGKSLYDFAGSD